MSCISRTVGNSPVEPGFRHVEGRPKWSIPWMEDDPGMTIPQLWVGRMRRDAADSLAYGCTGLMGIHWRTRVLGPERLRPGPGRLGPEGLEPRFRQERAMISPMPPKAPTAARWRRFPQHDGRHRRPASLSDGPLQHAALSPQRARRNLRGDVEVLRAGVPREAETRVFGVKIQGRTLVKGLDIFARVGQNRALDLTMKDVKVTNGKLAIDFLPEVEFPCIAAIAIEGQTAASNQFPARPFSRKINCGGPAYKDYEADLRPPAAASRATCPCGDFYEDWAKAEFGPEASKEIAAIFTRLDGHLPRPADWVTGPGSIRPDDRPWEAVEKEYAFVDEFCVLLPNVEGAGNLERLRVLAQPVRLSALDRRGPLCTWARYNAAVGEGPRGKDRRRPQAACARIGLAGPQGAHSGF